MKLPLIWRLALTYGLLAAVSCLAYLWLLYLLGANPFGKLKFIYFGIYGAAFAVAMRQYARFQRKEFKWYHGMGLGMLLNALATLFYGLLLYLSLSLTPFYHAIYDQYLPGLQQLASRGVQNLDSLRSQHIEERGLEAYQQDSVRYNELYQTFSTHLRQQDFDLSTMAFEQSVLGLFPLGIILTFFFTVFSIYTLNTSSKPAPEPKKKVKKKKK